MSCVFTACVLILSVSQGASAAESVVAPDFSLVAADGSTVRLSEEVRKQKTTMLFFWATWCPYCKALMPHLQSMRLEYGDQVEILAINIMEDDEPVEFLENAGYDFTLLLDGDAVAEAYRITGTPGVIVVDRKRVVHFDLRRLPARAPPANVRVEGHRGKAAYLAPYWASEIRKSIDAVLKN